MSNLKRLPKTKQKDGNKHKGYRRIIVCSDSEDEDSSSQQCGSSGSMKNLSEEVEGSVANADSVHDEPFEYSAVFDVTVDDKFSSTTVDDGHEPKRQEIETEKSVTQTECSSVLCIDETNPSEQSTAELESFSHHSVKKEYQNRSKNNCLQVSAGSDKRNSTMKLQDSNNLSTSDHVVICEHKEEILEISSDLDEPQALNSIKTIQPKITDVLQRIQPTTNSRLTFVSEQVYIEELQELEKLKLDLSNMENLFSKFGPTLSDGGKQLLAKVEKLKEAVQHKTTEVKNLKVDTSLNSSAEKHYNRQILSTNKPYPGQKGNAAPIPPIVNAVTMDRIRDIHGSLETCPGEDVLAEDPKGLKVSLMAHQKHALAWMNWRERQKPRGGILADDMGLGKTLTLISLILARKIAEKDKPDPNSSDSEDEENQKNLIVTSSSLKAHTLVVCPASLTKQWEAEVGGKVSGSQLSTCVYHGSNRDWTPRHLGRFDIVITTYNIISREYATNGTLFRLKWNRIILDEAHVIRNHKTKSSTAVCELRSKYRWALTGTPVQNREMDMYALLKFLRCTPFDELSYWKRYIDNKSAGGQRRLNTLIKSLMLRRTKEQLQAQQKLNSLPDRTYELIEVNLEKEEMNVYQKIMIYSRSLFAQFLLQRDQRTGDFASDSQRRTPAQINEINEAYRMHTKIFKLHHIEKEVKSHEILMLLLRLRQICCHPGLIDAMLEDDADLSKSSLETCEDMDLLEQLNRLTINDNTHAFQAEEKPSTSSEAAMAKAWAKVLQRSNPVFNFDRPSSKMRSILQLIDERIMHNDDKAIIISQWTSVLNVLNMHLTAKGIHTLSLNGSVPVKSRQDIIDEFNNPKTKPKVLLLSLTSGGVGLNLCGANHLLLIDLHWNPQLEKQAQDRIYRVGQKKRIHIYKFICKSTIEERIQALQQKKLEIADGLLNGVKTSVSNKLSIDDLKGLFGI